MVAPAFFAAVVRDAAENLAERMREADVADQPAAEERARAPLRPIEELIGNDDVGGLVFLLEAADRARGEDVLDAEHLHAEDVGAEVQLGRQKSGGLRRDARETPRALPRSVPRTYGPDGSPNGVVSVASSRSVTPAMSYRPVPPMMPICARCISVLVWGSGIGDPGSGKSAPAKSAFARTASRPFRGCSRR